MPWHMPKKKASDHNQGGGRRGRAQGRRPPMGNVIASRVTSCPAQSAKGAPGGGEAISY
jgi:hypothetical protein